MRTPKAGCDIAGFVRWLLRQGSLNDGLSLVSLHPSLPLALSLFPLPSQRPPRTFHSAQFCSSLVFPHPSPLISLPAQQGTLWATLWQPSA